MEIELTKNKSFVREAEKEVNGKKSFSSHESRGDFSNLQGICSLMLTEHKKAVSFSLI